MTSREEALKEIEKLKHGEEWTWPESDYGRADIWRLNDRYFLFEIPTFGGTQMFSGSYWPSKIEELVDEILSWT